MPVPGIDTCRCLLGAAALALCLGAGAARSQGTASEPQSVAPYVPTPWTIVDRIMSLASITPSDYVVDLGSGDGRLVITAVKRYGARAGYGVDIDESLVKLANANAEKEGVGDRVRFEKRDLFATSVGDASLVTLYLLPTAIPRLQAKLLAELPAGARVVSHDYPFPDWPPERVITMDVPEKVSISGTTRTVLYLYVVPARIAGAWSVTIDARAPFRIELAQTAARASGELRSREKTIPIPAVRVTGSQVELMLPAGVVGASPVTLRGIARGDTIEGKAARGETWRAVRAK